MNKIEKIYTISESFLVDYLFPFLILFISIILLYFFFLKIQLTQNNIKWSNEKCVPKYMFVSGLVKANPGSGMIRSTYDNFVECVNAYKVKKTKR